MHRDYKVAAIPGVIAAGTPRLARGLSAKWANIVEKSRYVRVPIAVALAGLYWWHQEPRMRDQMDSMSRERFIRNYEELLRAYYRNLADSNRREGND